MGRWFKFFFFNSSISIQSPLRPMNWEHLNVSWEDDNRLASVWSTIVTALEAQTSQGCKITVWTGCQVRLAARCQGGPLSVSWYCQQSSLVRVSAGAGILVGLSWEHLTLITQLYFLGPPDHLWCVPGKRIITQIVGQMLGTEHHVDDNTVKTTVTPRRRVI
jgi:hypothetical protein